MQTNEISVVEEKENATGTITSLLRRKNLEESADRSWSLPREDGGNAATTSSIISVSSSMTTSSDDALEMERATTALHLNNDLPTFSRKTLTGSIEAQHWEDMEDRLLITLGGDLALLGCFRRLHANFYDHDGRSCDDTLRCVLQSAAYLSFRVNGKGAEAYLDYGDHLLVIATYLIHDKAQRLQKVQLLQTILTGRRRRKWREESTDSPWQQMDDKIITDLLDHIPPGERRISDPPDLTSFMLMEANSDVRYHDTILWELIAVSVWLQRHKEQDHIQRIAKHADTAAIFIGAGGKLMETCVSRSGVRFSSHIESAGRQVKDKILPRQKQQEQQQPLGMDESSSVMLDRNTVIALTYSGAAKRLSKGTRDTTKIVMNQIRETSARTVHSLSQRMEEEVSIMDEPRNRNHNVSQDYYREAVGATVKVGLATVGAASMVGDAMLETSRMLMEKTAVVTADIVEHRYGRAAGQVANDAGETAFNLICTAGNVAVVSSPVKIVKMAAKDNAKRQASRDAEKAQETLRAMEEQAKMLFRNSIGNGSNVFRVMGGTNPAMQPR